MARNPVTTQYTSSRLRLAAYLSTVILLWSLSPTVAVVTLRSMPPMLFCVWGAVSGSLVLLIAAAVSGRGKYLSSYSVKDHLDLVLFAILGYAGYQILKYMAFTCVSVVQANILQYTYPIFIVVFATFVLKQRMTIPKFVCIVMGFAGAAIILSGGRFVALDKAHSYGYFLALCAGASFALFSVLASRASYEPVSSMFFIQLYSTVMVSLLLFSRGEFSFPSTLPEIAGILYTGVLVHTVGVMLLILAQQAADDVSDISGVLYLIPFLSLFGFKVFLNSPVPFYSVAGLVFIIGGIGIHTYVSKQR